MADLEMNAVVRKTEIGINALKVRDKALSTKQRMLLIVVDGTKSVAALSKLNPSPDEVPALLAGFLQAGLVERVEAATENAQTQSAPNAALAARSGGAKGTDAKSDDSLKAAIRRSAKFLENLIGPAAEGMVLQLEKCRSMDDLTAKVNDYRRVVASAHSETKADEFVAASLGV
jgi:hypothetical protein